MGSSLQCRLVRNVSFAQRSGSTWRRHMRRKRASDFPQELLDLFDGYVHGGISRRQFLDRAQKFAFGGVSAAALFQMLKRNYAWVMQIQVDDKRIKTEAAPSLPRHLRHVRAFGTPACSTNVH